MILAETDLSSAVKKIEDLFNLSRDIFFDRYLGDILKLRSVVYNQIDKFSANSAVQIDRELIDKHIADLIKKTEMMVRGKVAEEYLSSQAEAETAKNILIKKFGFRENAAMKKIDNESYRSCQSVSEVSKLITVASDFVVNSKNKKKAAND
ncbi:MAG: hypothetical protein PHV17_08115 [Candidatus Omnitrophica bacterium]|nr:hypothetical protein [Candidatus Omnitrophota bacterium]